MNAFITAVATETAIPINVIQAIIAAIMQLIAMCPQPAPAPSEVKGGSMRWTITVYRAMLMSGVRPLSVQGKAIHASMLKHAAEVSDADATEFLAQCGQVAAD